MDSLENSYDYILNLHPTPSPVLLDVLKALALSLDEQEIQELSIGIGKELITRDHPDYSNLSILYKDLTGFNIPEPFVSVSPLTGCCLVEIRTALAFARFLKKSWVFDSPQSLDTAWYCAYHGVESSGIRAHLASGEHPRNSSELQDSRVSFDVNKASVHSIDAAANKLVWLLARAHTRYEPSIQERDAIKT